MSQCGNRLDDVDVWVAMVALAFDEGVALTRQLAQHRSGHRCHQLVTSRLIGQNGFCDDESAAVYWFDTYPSATIRWSWSATMLGVVPMVGSICSSKLADTASREMIGAHVDYLGLDVPPDRQPVVGHRRQADQLNADWITRFKSHSVCATRAFPPLAVRQTAQKRPVDR